MSHELLTFGSKNMGFIWKPFEEFWQKEMKTLISAKQPRGTKKLFKNRKQTRAS